MLVLSDILIATVDVNTRGGHMQLFSPRGEGPDLDQYVCWVLYSDRTHQHSYAVWTGNSYRFMSGADMETSGILVYREAISKTSNWRFA